MRAVCLALAGGALLASAGNAAAQLLPPLPPPPDPVSTVGDLTGLLGGSGSQPPADGGTGAGSGGSTGTPTDTTASGSEDGSAASGAGGSSAGAAAVPDTRAPRMTLKVVSSFAWVARTGHLKARVTTDEPGSVTVGGTLRAAGKVVRLKPAVATYRAPGAKTVTIKLSRTTLRRLARVRSLRVSLQATGLDAARNRAFTSLKRTLTRPREVAHLRHRPRAAPQRAVEGRR